jgi:DNA helicase-2/ATP-dependent DNA helicase PcrA
VEAAQIAAQYERQRDVLEEPHIKELITLAKLVCSLTTEQIHYQQELLVEALAADFWGIERKVIWQLAIEADERRKNGKSGRWLDAMLESDDQRLKELATWLLDVAARAQIEPLNNLIDELIGPEQKSEKFSSPFRQFYFHKDSYQENPQKYLQFLGSLNTFINKVRSFVAKLETPKLADLVECVNLHEKHQLAITDTSPSLSGNQAITLISAHKAKGLEFDTVFVINCQESIWSKAQGHDLIAFPKNLAIDPSGETIDDYLRLFFVALTRAKRHLYLTSYTHNDNGKASLRLPFLEALQVESFVHDIAREHKQIDITATIKSLESSLFGVGKINIDEQSILQPLLNKYILSVTHLNTFLNITRGGPQTFFEQNLLRFPQAKTALASYGTAMHATMEAIYSHLKKTGVVPTLNQAKEFYQEKLTKENLPAQVLEQYLDKGNETLRVYLLTASKHLDPSHLIEVDFRMQQVMIGSTQITGKIDKVVPQEEDKAWEVYDFKTGNPARDWKGKDEKEKIKLHGYKRQLVFYKLLVESSRDYNNYQVKLGSLEFLNPTKAGEIVVLPYQITDTDVERMKKLIVAVDKKIRSLDFPDVSSYEESLTGIMQFEDDLINGKI